MESKKGLLLVCLFCLGLFVNAQDCTMYFPDRVGSTREMKSYDQKEKLSSITRQEILEKIENGNDILVKVRSSSFDKKDEEIYTGDLELLCEGGIFKFDLKSYLDPATLASYEEMGVEITSDNLVYPSNLNAGDKLPDGALKMVVKSGNATIITITLNISNRKVESRESITTDAGTFTAYKLSYDVTSKMGFITTNSSVVEWMAQDVGLVRSETFNKKGKLMGYSVLTAYSE
jgi:hypothetical protein